MLASQISRRKSHSIYLSCPSPRVSCCRTGIAQKYLQRVTKLCVRTRLGANEAPFPSSRRDSTAGYSVTMAASRPIARLLFWMSILTRSTLSGIQVTPLRTLH
jgi:hypothetical protein